MIVPAHIKPPKHSNLYPQAAAISNMTCRDKRFPPKENIKISPRIPWFLIWKVIRKKGSKTFLDQLSYILPWLQRVSWSEMPGKLKHCKSEVLITKKLAKKKAMENLVKTTTPSLSLSLMFFLLSMMSSISGTRRQLEDKTKPTFDRWTLSSLLRFSAGEERTKPKSPGY